MKYKMKGSPMQRNFGISPTKATGRKGEETTITGDYATTVDKFSNFKGNEKAVRAAVIANNKGKGASNKSRIAMNTAIQLWRKNNPTPPVEKMEKTTKAPTEVVERYHGAGGDVVTEKGKFIENIYKT
jgi:hypothetical protein